MFNKDFIKKTVTNKSIIVGINVIIKKEGDYYVAFCPALNLSSYATTSDKAKQRFDEEVKIFIEETSKKGTLEKLLLQLGWTLIQKPKPRYEPPKIEEFPLPQIESFVEKVAIPVC